MATITPAAQVATRSKKLRTRQRRRVLIEELESRQLLSDVPLTSPQVDELKAHLAKIGDFAEHVDSLNSLSNPLPLLGTSFNTVIDLSQVLNDRFAGPLINHLQPGQTSDQIAAYLAGDQVVGQFGELTFDVGSTTGGEENGELVFDTTLFASRSVDYSLDLGNQADTAGLVLTDDGSGDSIAQFNMTFDLRFGIDLNSQFFAEIEALSVEVIDAVEIAATSAKPAPGTINQSITFTVLINNTDSVTATLPATTPGNLSPLSDRLTQAISGPLTDAGFGGALRFSEFNERLVLRATSPMIESLELIGDAGLGLLGFNGATSAARQFEPNLDYGLLELATSSGGLVIDGLLDVSPDTGGDGRLDEVELIANPALTLMPRGTANVSLPVQPTTSSYAGGSRAVVRGSRSPLFGLGTLLITLDQFEPLDTLHDQTVATLEEGLAAVTQFGARVESADPFANILPALEQSLGETLDFEDALRSSLEQPIADLLAAKNRPSWDDVRGALNSVPGVTVTDSTRDSETVSLSIRLDHGTTTSQRLVLGGVVEESGLIVEADTLPTLDVSSNAGWDLNLALDRRQSGAPLESFSVRFDSLVATTEADATVAFDGRIGLLETSISGGQVDMDATLSATIAGGQAVSASTLLDGDIDSLLVTVSGGDTILSLPVSGSIGSQMLSASLALATTDVFGGLQELQPVGFDVFEDFQSYTAGDLIGGLEQLGGWFDDYAVDRLGSAMPLTEQTILSDAVDLRAAYDAHIGDFLKDGDGKTTFTTTAELQSQIPSVVAVDYSPGDSELTLDFQFSESMQYQQPDGSTSNSLAADLSLDFDLGPLVGFSSDATLSLTAGVDGVFRLAIDLTPLGADAAPITMSTPLADLNGGMGVMIDAGDDIQVKLRDGNSFLVSFDGSLTVGDAIASVHAARDAASIPVTYLQVEIREMDGRGVGLRLTDGSPDLGSDFRISSAGGSLAGLGLGLVGLDEDGDGIIDGKPLHGDTLGNHVFIERIGSAPLATGTVQLQSDPIDATANLGFVAVDIQGANFVDRMGTPSHLVASVNLVDPTSGVPVDRVSLTDLFRSLDPEASLAAASVDLSGQIDLNVPVSASVAGNAYAGTIDIELSDFGQPYSPTVTRSLDSGLNDLSEVRMSDILGGLQSGLAELLTLESESAFSIGLPIVNTQLPEFLGLNAFLQQLTEAVESIGQSNLEVLANGLQRAAGEPVQLPDLNVSISDLAGFFNSVRELEQGAAGGPVALADLEPAFADHFGVNVVLPDVAVDVDVFSHFADGVLATINDLQLSEGGSMQQIESILESALGLPDSALNLAIDTSSGSLSLRLDLQLEKLVTGQLPLSLGLEDLGLSGVGELIDVSGSSTFNLSAGAAAMLSFGLQVVGSDVQPFLYDFQPVSGEGTHIQLTAGVAASDIEFDASLGPLGIAIAGGSAGINKTGAAGDNDPAEFLVTLSDDGDGRIFLDETFSLSTSATGGAFATLPIEIPRGNPVTQLEFSTGDLTQSPDASSFNVSQVQTAIEDRISALSSQGIGSNLLTLVGGFEGAFDLLIDGMRGEVLGVPLPLIGDALVDEADFLEDIKASVLDNIRDVADQGITLVQTGIFDALGPGGLNLLQDATGEGSITPDDVVAVVSADFQRVDFDLHLRKAVEAVDFPVQFDLGLPGLNLDVDAPVELSFGADFRLGFGASISEGFFIATDPARSQLELFFDADVPQLSAEGELAFLDIVASTIPGSPTGFGGSFVVNLSDSVVGDDNGLLALDEMFAGSFSDVIDHTLSARADVDLNLLVSLGDNSILPRLRTDLIVDWEFVAGQGFNAPDVRFENVEMNLGDFFSGFAGEVLGEVQDILEPVQPIIKVLTQRLPVISDLTGSTTTLVDLARLFGRADVADFAQAVIDVNNLIVGLPEIGPDTWIALGGFGVDPGALGGYGGPGSTPDTMVAPLMMTNVQENPDPIGQVGSQGGSSGGQWTNNLQGAKGSLSFPLLESPLTTFQLLLGQDVDLFLYDAPALGIDFSYSQFFPIPPFPILGAEVAGRLAAVADFAFGFDTTGISEFSRTGNFLDVFNGFFVSDRANPDGTGADVPEVYLRGSLTAGAKLELLIAQAGVRGGIFAGVDFNLNDPNHDGRVRGGELADNFALGPIHIFDVSGKVDAGLVAFVDVNLLFFQIHEEYEIARANLLDFEIVRPAPGGVSPTELLTSRAGDVLTIKFTEQDDAYKILPGATQGSIIVQGQGRQTVELTGISEIRGNALGGNDVVTISPDVLVPVELDGGLGNDLLTAGGGAVVFRGGPGKDQLVGGPLDDVLRGGDDDDTLVGGSGNDVMEAGAGDDFADGGRNEDFILGGEGNDVLVGGFGSDTIEGNGGDDFIDGQRGNDLLIGGDGADQIAGDRGDDQIDGGLGNDILLGQEGGDTIDGGEGDDVIDGGQRNDVIRAGSGNDTVDGGSGNDDLDGGAGDDQIRGGGGADTIHGRDGHDLIYADVDELGDSLSSPHTINGGTGNDTIYGSRADDLLSGGDGNDQIFALAGNDVVDGGAGHDTINAGIGNDLVIGGFGNDVIDGGQGNDVLWGGVESFAQANFDLSDPSLFEKPPRFDEATAAGGSVYSLMVLITPRIVVGQSVPGLAGDGLDQINGGDGTDWLFGGSQSDALFGGAGADYVDGGSGDDVDLFGGTGEDIIRGGSGNDVIHGGMGIDQVYGESGRDSLFGDGGDVSGATDGQRLFGGDDADTLYAWAAGDASDVDRRGDELWGGSGGDFLYGNLRNDLLIGEAGSDLLVGDWGAGPNYVTNTAAALNTGGGGDDTLWGGSGQDQLFGGGGDDSLVGGSDGDLLEGQDGRDELIGGGGIDFVVLDVNPQYEVFGEQRIDGHGDGSPEDNATDALLVSGTTGDDTIRLRSSLTGEEIRNASGAQVGTAVGDQLMVEFGDARIEAIWSAGAGPLIEQLRISGATGDDTIEFISGDEALDLSSLIARSRDFVTTIDGGPGNDTIIGSPARDRIDGGRGSDLIWGLEGDDRLWGDQGPNDGSVSDHDVIYAGGGNDDVLGGQGSNELFAWSLDPRLGTEFGVFRGSDGSLQTEIPADDGSGITYDLEDTGLNRIIGSPRNDVLYGGTGLDLLFGGGGTDQLITRDGTPFEDLDGAQAGDAWKEYAKSTGHVWYVGGTNVDDEISVDFVTEPGFLLGHHLVTRLTNNNGNSSFDAQVRLDFSATDSDGNLIWNPDDVLADTEALRSDDPFARAAALNEKFSDRVALSQLLPPEGDFRAIIIDALAGNDIINVGPTVQKTVWIDAGEGDDEVLIASGRAILIDQTDEIAARNDQFTGAYQLNGPARLTGPSIAPADGVLSGDATFYLIVDDLSDHVEIVVPASMTDGSALGTSANTSLDDLIEDINHQINATAASGLVVATRSNDSIALSTTSIGPQSRLAMTADASDPAVTQLGLAENASALPSDILESSATYNGLTIDNPSDIDHYQFQLSSSVVAGGTAKVHIESLAVEDGIQISLLAADGTPLAGPAPGEDGIELSALALIADQPYILRVESNAIPTVYAVQFDLLTGVDSAGVDLGAIQEFKRQDVIFGGSGNDLLQGGPGEDFIFGGSGNDVLTGGADRGAGDLLFGQDGDDTFQSIPDALPVLSGTETTFLPTVSDRFDGGSGENLVAYLGGDLDRRGAPVNDFVAMKFNRLLQRFEVSSYVWDINNQRFASAPPQDVGRYGDQLRHWHFYEAINITATTFELAGGDDVLRLDDGFVFPDDSTGTTWGIAAGDIQAGATALSQVVIDGGDGNDQLLGGSVSETLLGGAGADFIAGGLGDDTIEGGDGGDYLTGGQTIGPDRFELVTRSFGSAPNDTFQFAADLPSLIAGDLVGDLSFHDGDSQDWYIVRAEALQQFVGQSSATITSDTIQVFEIDPVSGVRTGNQLGATLFLAETTGTETEPALVPFGAWLAGSESYLLRVENRLSTDIEFEETPRTYEFEVNSALGDTTAVSVERLADPAAGTGFARSAGDVQIRINGQNIGGHGTFTPIGDFNGDGEQDFIIATAVDSTALVSYARIVYGGDPLLDPGADQIDPTSGTVLVLPYQLLTGTDLPDPTRLLPAGDVDGDGFDDLLLSYASSVGPVPPSIIFGAAQSPDVFNVAFAAGSFDRVIPIEVNEQVVQRVWPLGDVDGDGLADFVINDDSGVSSHLVFGKPRTQLVQSRSAIPGTDAYDFEVDTHAFVLTDNDGSKNFWSRTDGRLVMGGTAGYANSSSSASTQARAVSPEIFLGVADPVLSFDHLLRTDQAGGFDIARVFVQTDVGDFIPLAGASNQGGLLLDGMNPAGAMVPLSFSLAPYVGSSIRIVFDFDSIDNQENSSGDGVYGWAIDNIQVTGQGISAFNADVGPTRQQIVGGTASASSFVFGRLAAIGDINGDSIDDFAEYGPGSIQIYHGVSDQSQVADLAIPDAQITGTFPVDGPITIHVARIDDDAADDFVISGALESTVVLSTDLASPITTSLQRLVPIGDFNGNGQSELASIGASSEFGTINDRFVPQHSVTHVYFSDDTTVLRDKLTSERPDLVLEASDAKPSFSGENESPFSAIGSLADVSGDGINEVVHFAPNRAALSVIYGATITANPSYGDADTLVATVELTPPRLAAPQRQGAVLGPLKPNANLLQASNPRLIDATSIEGVAGNGGLTIGGTIGDVNGDGVDDVVLRGEGGDSVILGELALGSGGDITEWANLFLTNGRLITPGGDLLDADGIDDLVVVGESCNALFCVLSIDIYPGGSSLQRELTSAPRHSFAFQSQPQPSNGARILESATVSILNWDGDQYADLMVGYRFNESTTIVHVYQGSDLDAPPTVFEVNSDGIFTATPVGDINGDGLDDIAIASPDHTSSLSVFDPGQTPGKTYLLLGGQSGSTQLDTDSHAIITGTNLGDVISPLGDLNEDGYDDFAISRSLEASGSLDAGLLIYFGKSTLRTSVGTVANLTDQDADIRIVRADAGSLVTETALAGPILATAGDLDHDGRKDLVVGIPRREVFQFGDSVPIEQSLRGQTSVFFDVLSKGARIELADADRTLVGTGSDDLSGALAAGPLSDLTGDQIDDLLIGAAGADGTRGGFLNRAGQVYLIPGSRSLTELPDDSQVSLLENFSGRLVDTGTSQPIRFDGLSLDGQADWFRFSTAGDGGYQATTADQIRISPGAASAPSPISDAVSGAINDGGLVLNDPFVRIGGDQNGVGVVEFDLRSLIRDWSDPALVPEVTLQLSARSTDSFFSLADMSAFTTVGSQVFFVATDPSFGSSLFVSDGTTEGTRRIGLAADAGLANLTLVGDELFFTAFPNPAAKTMELWKTNGTPGGTSKVIDIDITADDFSSGGGKLFFTTRAGLASNPVLEVWESDGELTFRRELTTLFNSSVGFGPGTLTVAESDVEENPILFLSGEITPYTGPVLMASPGNNPNDGRGIRMVGDSSIGTRHREPVNMHAFDGFLAFQARNSSGNPTPLLVTNGVINASPQASAFSLFFTGTQPANPTGFLVDKDSYTLLPANFDSQSDYNAWATTLGLDLNRDTLYVFGDSPSGGGKSLYQIRIDEIFDNGIRGGDPVEREIFTLRLRSTEIASQIPANPHSLVIRGDDLFFVADDEGQRGTEVFQVDKNLAGQTPSLVSDINPDSGDSNPSELTVLENRVFFTASDGFTRGLYEVVDDGSLSRQSRVVLSPNDPSDLRVAGDRLLFVAEGALWSSDGDVASPIRTTSLEQTDLTLEILAQEADLAVTLEDGAVAAQSTVNTVLDGNADTLSIDLTQEIAAAIASGQQKLTLRISAPTGSSEIQLVPAVDPASPTTRLDVLARGLLLDLIDDRGQFIDGGKALIDLRNVVAGTYFLRVRQPQGTPPDAPLPYSIEIDAPAIGDSHGPSDRDRILGGSGNDRLFGGAELDALFGEGGVDQFRGDILEIFDRDLITEEEVSPELADLEIQQLIGRVVDPEALTDPAIDLKLIAAVARALGRPVTTSLSGEPLIHDPIFSSDVAELQSLNLSGLGLNSLVGLDELRNLRSLDLSDNALTSAALPTTLTQLEVLDLSSNQITAIQASELQFAANLEALYLDGNQINDLSDLAGIAIIDDGDSNYAESGAWQANVGTIAGAWQDDYRFSKDGGQATYTFDLPAGDEFDLFITWPVIDHVQATGTEVVVSDGQSTIATIPLFQSTSPALNDPAFDFAGRPWQPLGRYSSPTGQLSVTLVGIEGVTVAADAVRAQAVVAPQPSLQLLSLLDNPLNDVSRDGHVSHLVDQGLQVFTTPNQNAPQIEPIAPLTTFTGLRPVEVILRLAGGGTSDADGDAVAFSASSDDPDVDLAIVGDRLVLDYPSDFAGSARITVIATDLWGRQGYASFDLNVMSMIDTGPSDVDINSSTILTFDGGFGLAANIDPNYGDRVTSLSSGSFSYGGGASGPSTPNIVVDYGSPNTTRFWNVDFGDLVNSVHRATGVSTLDIMLQADPGYRAVLHGFDLGGWPDTDRLINSIEVIDQSGTVLFSQTGITILGAGPSHSDFDFPSPLIGESLLIRLDPGASQSGVGIDNIQFSQFEIGPGRIDYGSVFDDVDGDGVRGPDEPGIAGVTLHLLDSEGNGIACTVTDVAGNYRIEGGSMTPAVAVQVMPPNGWQASATETITLDPSSPNLPVRPSTDFSFSYEFDVDPTDPLAIDIDSNGLADMSSVGTPTITAGVAALVTNQRFGINEDTTTSWPTLRPSVETGFTLDVRVKVIDDPAFPEGVRGSMTVAASADATITNTLLNIDKSSVGWGGSVSSLGSFDNTDGFHDFRIVQLPGTGSQFFVWRDGVLLNPDGDPLGAGINFQSVPRLIIGDGGSPYAGHVEIDFIRFSEGAYSPGPELEFGLVKPIDIGVDRLVAEGSLQTFAMSGSAFEPSVADQLRYRWEVFDSNNTIIATAMGETFDHIPANEGDYRIVASKERNVDQGGGNLLWVPEFSDELLLRVYNTPPQSVIFDASQPAPIVLNSDESPSANSDLTVPEGSSILLAANISDSGIDDDVLSYLWTMRNEQGAIVASAADPVGSFLFEDEGIYEATLIASDGVSSSVSEPFRIVVTNVLPQVTLSNPMSVGTAGPITVSGSFSDPGKDLWLGQANLGDGTRKPMVLRQDGTFELDHSYSKPGHYQVTVTVSDQDGGVESRSFDVIVDPLAPTAIATADVASINESSQPVVGSQWVTTLEVSDLTISDAHSFELVSGTGDLDNSRFTVQGNQLFLQDGQLVDYETQPQYRVRVAATDRAGNLVESELTIQVNNLPEIESVDINDGEAQRSRVSRLQVRFDQVVELTDTALEIRRNDGELVNADVSYLTDNDETIVEITFAGGGAIGDGQYQLIIRGDQVDAGGFAMEEDTIDSFYQKYGDADGNNLVNLTDFAEFRASYSSSEGDAGFAEYLDANDDGKIDLSDFAEFRSNYGS